VKTIPYSSRAIKTNQQLIWKLKALLRTAERKPELFGEAVLDIFHPPFSEYKPSLKLEIRRK
jgi:hypothetical protein